MIVAGAGIIGLSCAWRLAQKGIKVRIFESREASREASWAGAGMLAPGGELVAEPGMDGCAEGGCCGWERKETALTALKVFV